MAPIVRYRTVRIFIARSARRRGEDPGPGEARSDLQQALLELLLTDDAVAGPGNGLEPLAVDLGAALDALAEAAVIDTLQCLVHLLEYLAVGVGQRVEELLGVGAAGLVGEILGALVFGQPAVRLVLVVGLRQRSLAIDKLAPEHVELLGRHRRQRRTGDRLRRRLGDRLRREPGRRTELRLDVHLRGRRLHRCRLGGRRLQRRRLRGRRFRRLGGGFGHPGRLGGGQAAGRLRRACDFLLAGRGPHGMRYLLRFSRRVLRLIPRILAAAARLPRVSRRTSRMYISSSCDSEYRPRNASAIGPLPSPRPMASASGGISAPVWVMTALSSTLRISLRFPGQSYCVIRSRAAAPSRRGSPPSRSAISRSMASARSGKSPSRSRSGGRSSRITFNR